MKRGRWGAHYGERKKIKKRHRKHQRNTKEKTHQNDKGAGEHEGGVAPAATHRNSPKPRKIDQATQQQGGRNRKQPNSGHDQEKKTTNNSIKRKKELTGIRGSTKTFSK